MKHYQALIGRAASSMTQRRGDATASDVEGLDGLLFMGNPHETVPRALLLDRRLGAVDVLGWQVIRLLSNTDRTTAFPTYDELEPLLRSGANRRASRKTVARVIAILRLTRWMTLGMKARNTDNGRMIGNVYVLHDEPLAAGESLALDPDYLAYVIQCSHHGNQAVAAVAECVKQELADSGVLDTPTRLAWLDRRAKQQVDTEFPMETLSPEAQFPMETQPDSPSSQRKLSEFPSDAIPSSQRKLMRNSVGYDAVSDASRGTTVRCNTNSVGNTTAREASVTPLVWSWPLELSGDQREAVSLMLTGLPNDVRQAVVDEAAGRLDAGKVKSPMAFLHTLAKRAVSGDFQLTQFGQSVADKRRSAAPPQPRPMPNRVVPLATPQPLSEETEAKRQAMLTRLGIRRNPTNSI
ncbi:MAG: hypothetical protein CMN25_00705 [Salinicola sp.]|uniref:STY4528 family pathogenicity island replication protein n=1 Tax=uncultured Salinicola sp. TaxID=1193542 RepID=UPI000C970385|nr:STY4528 family pathogenicity island replication protein [uncultured Salinicola sp.]MAM55843.1 hypothetical protein [Salinicola sp.]